MHDFKTALIALTVCAAFNLGTQALAAATQPAPDDGGEAAKAPDHGTLVIRPQGDQQDLGANANAADEGMNAADQRGKDFRSGKPDQVQNGDRGAQPTMEDRRNAGDRRPMDGYGPDQRMGQDPRMGPPPERGMAQGWREGQGRMDGRYAPGTRMGPPPERGMDSAYREGPRGMAGDGRYGPDPRMGHPRGRGYAQDWNGPRRGMMDGRMPGRQGPDPRMGPPQMRGYGMGPDPRMGPPPARGRGMDYGPDCQQYGMDWRHNGCPRQDSPMPRGRMPMHDGDPEGGYGVRMLPPAPQGRP